LETPQRHFAEESWTAGVIGLGYVGLPLLITAIDAGLSGIGFDTDPLLVERLQASRSPVDDVSDAQIGRSLSVGCRFTANPSDLEKADAIFICVPSPLGRDRQPDFTYLDQAARTIASVARPGQLICLESTSYPGTTEDLFLPAVEKAGLTLDEDVWVAYSPERISPGDNPVTADIPKVVGGLSVESGAVAAAAYSRLVPSVHLVSSARAAEMTKLLENTYRAVNIGLINELTQLSHELDIDIWEVVDAAATKPFGFHPFYPGPGVGGHCIPLDPQYLAWRARGANFATTFIETADQINSRMPEYVVRRAGQLLDRDALDLRGSRVLVVGLAYKRDVSDDRESASVEVARLLLSAGAHVEVVDPLVGRDRIEGHGFTPAETTKAGSYDLAVILTDHSDIAYDEVRLSSTRVLDTRGVYRRLGLPVDNVETL
jgi:UDP-N-acetyl-D-glucosamine dehydrogenase